MSTVLDVERTAAPPAPAIPARSLWFWSVRRELWENRSVVFAPIVVGFLVLMGFVVRALYVADQRRAGFDRVDPNDFLANPAHLVAGLILATAALVGVFYCLDALHGERSDRSILFWKSLPVSDRMTVLSKLSIPLVVLPLVSFVTILVAQVLMLASTAVILGTDAIGSLLPLIQLSWTLGYALVALALWHFPVYAYLLLVSSIARRMTIVVAILPLVLVPIIERIAFGTGLTGQWIKQRLFGFTHEAFASGYGVAVANPYRLATSIDLWLGLVLAALLIAATVWSRRRHGPI